MTAAGELRASSFAHYSCCSMSIPTESIHTGPETAVPRTKRSTSISSTRRASFSGRSPRPVPQPWTTAAVKKVVSTPQHPSPSHFRRPPLMVHAEERISAERLRLPPPCLSGMTQQVDRSRPEVSKARPHTTQWAEKQFRQRRSIRLGCRDPSVQEKELRAFPKVSVVGDELLLIFPSCARPQVSIHLNPRTGSKKLMKSKLTERS